MKVSELEGALLDYWVAKIQYDDGRQIILRQFTIYTNSVGVSKTVEGDYGYFRFAPSVVWDHGGPIIERERLVLMPWTQTNGEEWASKRKDDWREPGDPYFGLTPLIAAMRCYVAAVYGDEVDDSQTD